MSHDGPAPLERYRRSLDQLARAEAVIPLGSQTFSKSRTALPIGASPLFLERGTGSHVWDVDGNEYIDFMNGLLAISLGYNDPDVNAAVQAQLEQGVIFSLPHPIETEVAELIVELVPCAELVRFGKNGSDATAGAIRVARAFTGRDRVAVCGYHGWQDWYIGSTTRDLGVPAATKALTHPFRYNDVSSLEALLDAYPGEFAAVILEPMNTTWPDDEFLPGVAEATRRHGALLVFDETITGFRHAMGGGQELFGVTPDLATFGKGVANGFPLAIVTGRREYMRLMEDVFFSFTFGGETLSLAAAKAVIDKMRREPVLDTIHRRGQTVLDGVAERIATHGVGGFCSVSGHPAWSFFTIGDAYPYTALELKTLYLQEMFARGILIIGSHNMSYAHSDADIAGLLAAYDEVLPILRSSVDQGDLLERLRCEPLKPLFKVR
jgi:glutamate-1-semialdehyde 2,1-aminomutase